MALTLDQSTQIQMQIAAHQHKRYKTDIELAPGYVLKDFTVAKNVFRPDITSAVYLARWLFYNNGDYLGQNVIDMGSGSGLQGIVMALRGADYVASTDISEDAFRNTLYNSRKQTFGRTVRGQSVSSRVYPKMRDLFAGFSSSFKAGCIVFNHPFFENEYSQEKSGSKNSFNPDEHPISSTMMAKSGLIHRFLEDAKKHMYEETKIIMPFLHLAGDANNPRIQGPKQGYNAKQRFAFEIKDPDCIQQGPFSIYELTLDLVRPMYWHTENDRRLQHKAKEGELICPDLFKKK